MKLKDDAALLLAALVCCVGAWLFWHFAGKAGFPILLAIAMVSLLIDNVRLRRKLR